MVKIGSDFRPAALRTCVQLNKGQRRMSLGISTVKIIAKHTEIKPISPWLPLKQLTRHLGTIEQLTYHFIRSIFTPKPSPQYDWVGVALQSPGDSRMVHPLTPAWTVHFVHFLGRLLGWKKSLYSQIGLIKSEITKL